MGMGVAGAGAATGGVGVGVGVSVGVGVAGAGAATGVAVGVSVGVGEAVSDGGGGGDCHSKKLARRRRLKEKKLSRLRRFGSSGSSHSHASQRVRVASLVTRVQVRQAREANSFSIGRSAADARFAAAGVGSSMVKSIMVGIFHVLRGHDPGSRRSPARAVSCAAAAGQRDARSARDGGQAAGTINAGRASRY